MNYFYLVFIIDGKRRYCKVKKEFSFFFFFFKAGVLFSRAVFFFFFSFNIIKYFQVSSYLVTFESYRN